MGDLSLEDLINYMIDFGCPDALIGKWVRAYYEGKHLARVEAVPTDGTLYVVFNKCEVYVAV